MKKKGRFIYHILTKTLAFILMLVSTAVCIAGVFAINVMAELGFYFEEAEVIWDMHFASTENEVAWQWFQTLYINRYIVPAAALICGVLSVLLFVYLLCAAGRRAGQEEPVAGTVCYLPTDLATLVLLLAGCVLLSIAVEGFWGGFALVFYGTVCILLFCMTVGYCMFIARKAKTGTLWKNTACYWLWKRLVRLGHLLGTGFRNIPQVWQTAVIVVGITVAEFIMVVYVGGHIGYFRMRYRFWGFWFLEKVILTPLVLYVSMVMKKLQQASERLAAGQLDYQVDTSKMILDFKAHGENLNRIAHGMSKAVEERMKSEHLKTELITNVSHDIKTPLTSIINYSDLICREQTDNVNIQEYSEVLQRQSVRLKKLIEDLVEASKASTGNITAVLVPCEMGVIIAQAAGEFEQRLAQKDMDLIIKQPETPVYIMADGKLLWRVFDNLMNNICKYAQSSTRVYLTVEQVQDFVRIIFKNISESPLDISAEELMERFVRGDASRHTEGNGLGLSIARSLMELQKGTLELVVDGDLFKVILTLPRLNYVPEARPDEQAAALPEAAGQGNGEV